MKEKREKLYKEWKNEENTAHIKGWDFSHIANRYIEEDDLPWGFKSVIKNYLTDEMFLLDMETGGGEFLLTLNHPYSKTSAVEGYKPNVEYCKNKLLPLGIDFKEADGADILPFEDNKFGVVTNRHGSYTCSELKRVIKPKGVFITQQVGAENDRELIRLLQPEIEKPTFPEQYLEYRKKELEDNDFEILECAEVFRPIKFFDVGALVWFAKIIEWEFIGFEVDKYIDNLYKAQEILEKDGVIKGRIHRFYIVARKKPMKIGLASLICKNKDIDFNLNRIEKAMRELRGRADLLCFGEAYLQGFDSLCWDYETDKNMALSLESEPILKLRALTSKYETALLTGYIEKDGEKLYSSCIVLTEGEIFHNYRRISKGWKEFSKTDEHYCEGNDTKEFELMGKKMQIAICGDLWDYPERFKTENLLIWPVYVEYTPAEWEEGALEEYAAQAALAASDVLMINSIDSNPKNYGGSFYFKNGKLIDRTVFDKEQILIVNID